MGRTQGSHVTGATMDEVRPLLDENHYLGSRCADPVHCFADRAPGGLLGDTGTPLAAIVYAAPTNRYFGRGALEIVRLVRNPEYRTPLSSLVSWSLRWLRRQGRYDFAISYADSGHGHHGGIYQACSFVYVGMTKGHWRWQNATTGETVSNRSFEQRRPAYREGWDKERTSPKHLYFAPLSTRKRQVLNRFQWEELPYPKPEGKAR